jgi:hypothetical protein
MLEMVTSSICGYLSASGANTEDSGTRQDAPDRVADFVHTSSLAGSKPGKCYPVAVKRKTKIPIHEHQVTCPLCRTNLTILSPMETILLARRTCPKCKREFLIENGKTKRAPRERSNGAT